MKYLFFDIECSNCFDGIGKICEFGYVITDENFNILSKDVIPMSPGRGRDSRFHLKGRKNQKDLELAWDYDYYLEQPEFPHFYERIKALMTDKETICFGFDCSNDISYLYGTCTKYKKEPFDYICYDVQQLAFNYSQDKKTNLKNTYLKVVGPSKIAQFQEHLSRDDALMTMRIFEAVCILQNCSSKILLESNQNAKTSFKEWLETKIASEHIDSDAVSNMSDEESNSFSKLIEELAQLADQNKDKEEADIVSTADAFKALYIADKIKFCKDGDVLLFLTSMALLNTYVKQKDCDKRIGYGFKDLLNRLLLASKNVIFNSLKINYIDREKDGNNILIFELNNSYQFSYHCVEKRMNNLILKEYKCDNVYWGIKNKAFINTLFNKVLNNKIGFSNLTELEENLLENAVKFSIEMLNNPELKTNIRKRRGNGKVKSESYMLWEQLFNENALLLDNAEYQGKRYSISGFVKDSLELTNKLIDEIRQNGLVAVNELSKSDFLIVLNEEDKIRLLAVLKHPYSGTMLTVEEFEQKLK